MANVIEEAKSGRASCRTCKKTIAKGELRLGVEQMTQVSDTPSMMWHHMCGAAGNPPAKLKEALGTNDGDVPNRAELDKRWRARSKKAARSPVASRTSIKRQRVVRSACSARSRS